MQAFHVFHTSWLIHWILYCEFEIVRNQTVSTKGGRRSRKKNGTKSNTTGKDGTVNVLPRPIVSVFCPDCQGTSVNIEGDEFEKPLTPLSEMFKYKIKASEGHRGWMKNPEILENCSTGFHFPSQSGEPGEEKVLPLKSLHFYRPEE
ncbi:ACYL-UDP-N-ACETYLGLUCOSAMINE O-ACYLTRANSFERASE [Salix purpurea]|uniref:ACYL-UDP-N-ACETYLGLUCOSAMINE O-ACYLTRANSFERASE n=1 Tax=Salix purpurea TaxID=77065 RepID=A0A9Q1AAF5_SALPP|nr:ACYL-UDP-N-ACETYLGLUCOSAMINE O-ACYLTRANSFERASE [Salix purpurea]